MKMKALFLLLVLIFVQNSFASFEIQLIKDVPLGEKIHTRDRRIDAVQVTPSLFAVGSSEGRIFLITTAGEVAGTVDLPLYGKMYSDFEGYLHWMEMIPGTNTLLVQARNLEVQDDFREILYFVDLKTKKIVSRPLEGLLHSPPAAFADGTVMAVAEKNYRSEILSVFDSAGNVKKKTTVAKNDLVYALKAATSSANPFAAVLTENGQFFAVNPKGDVIYSYDFRNVKVPSQEGLDPVEEVYIHPGNERVDFHFAINANDPDGGPSYTLSCQVWPRKKTQSCEISAPAANSNTYFPELNLIASIRRQLHGSKKADIYFGVQTLDLSTPPVLTKLEYGLADDIEYFGNGLFSATTTEGLSFLDQNAKIVSNYALSSGEWSHHTAPKNLPGVLAVTKIASMTLINAKGEEVAHQDFPPLSKPIGSNGFFPKPFQMGESGLFVILPRPDTIRLVIVGK